MSCTTATRFWNDSCAVDELTYAIDNGAVGATTNPSIVLNVLKKEMPFWREKILEYKHDNPTWSEVEFAWQLIESMAVRGARLLLPVFEREHGLRGRISIQTNPQYYRDSRRLVEQAAHFDSLAPNIQVKIPVTRAGIEAIEDATYRGININATVCFCVPQALAVGAAVERGLQRREAEGKDIAFMRPVCTIMVGRMDDWLHVLEKRDGIVVTPGYPDWAGIACLKKAYGLFRERGYRAQLLSAAYRSHLHWSEFIGGDVILTIPCEWQKLFNASHVEVKERFNDPVDTRILDCLLSEFPDFRRAYDPQGMTIEEFDSFGPTVRTLRSFTAAYHDLLGVVRDVMLPNPDVK
jgi:transaldolase